MDEQTVGKPRRVLKVIGGMETSDGAGVSLRRFIGSPPLDSLDPFLLLDAFRSDDPEDYVAGFPPHPHRGFETVTYLLAGRMRHRDSTGREGVIEPGGVQWMTAGRGIEHSEMPEQENGLLYGFQLWVNLPAALKMSEPRYQEFSPGAIPTERREEGMELRVVAGCTSRGTCGPVRGIAVAPLYLDVRLPGGALLREPLPLEHTAFLFVADGAVEAGHGSERIEAGNLAVFSSGEEAEVRGIAEDSRLLLIAGRPIGEPVARQGPFVMNTREELVEAFRDYQAGRFGRMAGGA